MQDSGRSAECGPNNSGPKLGPNFSEIWFLIVMNILKKKEMMHRKPDDSPSNNEIHNTEITSQDDVDSMAVSSNQQTALDLAAHESASLKNDFGMESTVNMQTMQSVQTETINTFQTSTADSTEFFQSSYYYIIEVRISLRLKSYSNWR